MGDRATNAARAAAEQAAIEVLAPETRVVGDLAVAAQAAGEADTLRETARAKGQQLVQAAQARAKQLELDAEEEIQRRFDHWRQAWQAAKQAGWTPRRLRATPISQQPPPMTRRPRRAPESSQASGTGTVHKPGIAQPPVGEPAGPSDRTA
jgi:hypothetical protein